MANTDTSQVGYLITTEYGRSPLNAYQVKNVSPQVYNQTRQQADSFIDPTWTLGGSALVSGNAYTSLTVSALPSPLLSGQSVQLSYLGNTQIVVLSAGAAAGATSISVTSFTANYAYPAGTVLGLVVQAGIVETGAEESAPVVSPDSVVEESAPEAPVKESDVDSGSADADVDGSVEPSSDVDEHEENGEVA